MATWTYSEGKADTAFGDGSTHVGWAPQTYCYGAAMTLSAGTVTRLAAYTDSNGGAGVTLKLGLYDSGGTLIVQGSVGLPTSSTKAWNIADVADTAISGGTYYVLGSGSTSGLRYGYDTTGNGYYASVAYASAMASSATIDGPEVSTQYGVGAEVEASGGATSRQGLMLMSVGR